MNYFGSFLGVLVSSAFMSISARGAPNELTVKITTFENTRWGQLRVSIRNESRGPIKLYESELPWNSLSFWKFVAVPVAPSDQFATMLPSIDDPGPSTFNLMSGQSIDGILDLSKSLKAVEEICKTGDLLLFWSFKPMEVKSLPDKSNGWGQRLGGFVLVPGCE